MNGGQIMVNFLKIVEILTNLPISKTFAKLKIGLRQLLHFKPVPRFNHQEQAFYKLQTDISIILKNAQK